ncbi:MAG: hypothetical protein J5892_02735 [Bacilli bacterium]|nr:hypothetical protein [Bacilli bacterium]
MAIFATKKQIDAFKDLSVTLSEYSCKLKDASLVEQFNLVEEIHQLIKESAPIFYKDRSFCVYYKKLLDLVVECESVYSAGNYPYDGDIFSFYDRSDLKNVDNLLDYIATKIRKNLIEDYRIYIRKQYKVDNPYLTIDKVDVTNMCKRVSREVQEECEKLGVKCKRIRIEPGFSKDVSLYGGCGYHYFNVITFRGREYLMDLTYSQFFCNNSTNMLSRLGVPILVPCNPGIYMLMDEK